MSTIPDPTQLTTRRILLTWWPLALSWLLMSTELPMVSAVMARLPDPELSLAAYGGVCFPLAMMVEAPIIMLLSASTALSKDWASYQLVNRFMIGAGAALTLLHAAIAFTPLFDLVVGRIIGAPAEIHESVRIGLKILTPWTASIAYRRFHHGVLIRFGRARSVGLGTVVRVGTNALILGVGLAWGGAPGIVIGATAIAAGVVAEAIFIGFRARPILRGALRTAPPVQPALTWPAFLSFYIPLAATSFVMLLSQPIGAAGMSRMPRTVESLATWPILSGIGFMFRGVGFALNEVVVSLIEEPGARLALRRFAARAAAIATALFLTLVSTPLIDLWLDHVAALPPDLAQLARTALWFLLPMPAQAFFQSYYTGLLVHARQTRSVTESVIFSLTTIAIVIGIGVKVGSVTGVYISAIAIAVGAWAQVAWLFVRARRVTRPMSMAE